MKFRIGDVVDTEFRKGGEREFLTLAVIKRQLKTDPENFKVEYIKIISNKKKLRGTVWSQDFLRLNLYETFVYKYL